MEHCGEKNVLNIERRILLQMKDRKPGLKLQVNSGNLVVKAEGVG